MACHAPTLRMNFLAHFVVATRGRISPPAYVLGNALPDLLPLAAHRARFRPVSLALAPAANAVEAALRAGVLTHLRTDAAFHKAPTFAQAQADMKALLRDAGFVGMRLRPFFLAHVLAELALDAALLRAEPGLADAFYADFDAADFPHATRWTETTLQLPLPDLPGVLTRFGRSRYLARYTDDAGVADGLTALCARARQDTFEGANFTRLTILVAEAVPRMGVLAPALLAETAEMAETAAGRQGVDGNRGAALMAAPQP